MRFPTTLLLTLAALLASVAWVASGPADAQGSGLKVAVEPATLDMKPGSVANVTLVIGNPTDRTLSLEVGAQTINATPTVNVSFSPKTLTLGPNSTARVLVAIKSAPRAAPGDQPLLLGAHEAVTTTTTNPPPLSATTRLALRIVAAPTPVPKPTPASAPVPAATPTPVPAPAYVPSPSQIAIVVAGGAATLGGGVAAWSWVRRRGGWLALAAPLYTRLARNRILDQPTRKRLADLVLSEPGVTFSEAHRRLGIGAGALTHHARMLEQAGVVFSSADGQTRRLFPIGGGFVAPVPPLSERALAELRREPATLSALAARLGVSRQALHYHVKKLISEGKVRADGEVLASA